MCLNLTGFILHVFQVDMDMDDDLDDALVAAQAREADTAVDRPVKDDEGNML